MRKIDESRAANYIRKHSNYKKWLAFVLCLSLLTGTVTLYILNKPATAMTAEGADSIGAVLETLDSEGEAELIQDTLKNKLAAEGEGSGDGGDSDLFDLGQGDGDDGDDADGGDGQNGDDASDDGQDGDDAAKLGDTEETEEIKEVKDEQKADETALTEEEAAAAEATKEATEETEAEEDEDEASDDDLTQDVVLTVSYVDQNGESIADEKEISLEDSIDLTSDAPSFEGYTYKEATLDGDVITKITVHKNADDIRYYEVELKDGDTKEIKKDATVVLTYKKDAVAIVLTASYVDAEGEEIADEKELAISESFDPKKDADAIEGYTFKEAKIDEDIVVLITAKEDEETGDKFFEATLEDESTVEIRENTAVTFIYEVVDTTVVLTAKYVDKAGEEIQEAKELNIGDETELKKNQITEVEGYFFNKAIYEDKEIVKIAPVFEEVKDEDTTSEDSEDAVKKTVSYKFTTVDGDEIEVSDDAEIEFSYLNASTETEFTFDDSKVSVKATVNGKNVFPEGIVLKAVEVTTESNDYNYKAYLDAINENSESIAADAGQEQVKEFNEENTLLYDIAFVYDGKEIQPKEGTVTISIEFKKKQLTEDLAASSKEEIAVVHLPIKEEVKEENEIVNTEDAVSITANDIEVITLSDASAAVEEEQKVEFETDGFSIFAVLAYQNHEYGTHTFKNVLGDAVNFGYVADTIKVSESETNFAVNEIIGSDKQTGNDMTNPIEQTFIVAKTDLVMRVKGNPAYFLIPKTYADKIEALGDTVITLDTTYSEKELNTVVNDMLKYTRDASADLAGKDSKIPVQKNLDGQFNGKYVVDTYDLDDGSEERTYYVNISEKDFADININNSERLYINKRDSQTIVFNVKNSGDVTLHKFWISNDNWKTKQITDAIAGEKGVQSSDKMSRYAQTIIWNFINADSVTTGSPVAGVFITGNENATWMNTNTSAGWVVFPNIEIHAGEWHNTYQDVEKLSEKAVFQAYKNIDSLPSEVSGFEFTLYRKTGEGNASEDWEELQTVENDRHDIVFAPITYGNDKNRENDKNYQYVQLNNNQPKDYIYKIKETKTKSPYAKDSREFYAKVKVSYVEESSIVVANGEPKVRKELYRVSAPTYYEDPECKNKLDSIPTFNNITRLKVNKEWTQNGGPVENHEFKTPIYIRVWRSVGEGGKKQLLKWDTDTNKVSNSENAPSVLMLYSDNEWSVELIPDKIHPEGSTDYYRYYVQEVVKTGNDEYKEKTEFVTYSSSYKNLTGKDWKTVYAYADPSADPSFTLTVTNDIGSNVLPSTGGVGDIPYLATGLGTAVAGLVGAKAYSKKKKKDDEE